MNNEVKSIKVLTGHLTATNKKVVSMILDNREEYKDENGNFVGNRGGITYTIKQKSDTEFKVTTREKDKDMSGRVIWRDYSSDVVINYKPKKESKEMKSVKEIMLEMVLTEKDLESQVHGRFHPKAIKKSVKEAIVSEKLQEWDTVKIGTHWLSALYNGDESGLSEEEIELLDAWERKLPKPYTLDIIDDDPEFGVDVVSGLRGDVVRVRIMVDDIKESKLVNRHRNKE